MKANPISTAKINWQFETAADAKLGAMLAAAQSFADEIKSGMPPRWLSFCGASGIGKTHLAKALYRWYDDHGCRYLKPTRHRAGVGSCRFVRWRCAASDLRSGEWSLIQDLIDRDFLVLDDIGAEHQGGTGAVKSGLERIVDERLGKWTVITSNLTHKAIAEQLDTRIASRMIREGNIVINARNVADFNARKAA